MKTRLSLLWIAVIVSQIALTQVHIPVSDPDTWNNAALKPYIGQKVVFDAPIVVCSSSSSSLLVSTRRLFKATNQALPGTPECKAVDSLNYIGQMWLEGVSGYHRSGEKIYNLTALVNSPSSLTWISGEWQGNSRKDMAKTDVRQLVNIADCEECLLICTFNIENYFVENIGYSYMGANSYAEHQQQRTKVSKALKKINADIFGLVEVEQTNAAVQEITDDLNANLPERNYTFQKDSKNSSFQKVEFVYDSKKVRPIGAIQETSYNTIGGEKHKMICFEQISNGERFIFSINHFKAKIGTGVGADADQKDGQGVFNASRTGEAQAVVNLYNRYYPLINEKDLLVMGDLNSNAKEDPIMKFIDNEMIDLHRAFHADSSYSYMHGDRAGYLDHAICNSTLYRQVKGTAAYHINSDENDRYAYDNSNDTTMFRCSDHDPVLVGMKLDKTLVYDPTPALNSIDVITGEAETMIISNAYRDNQKSFYRILDISGNLIDNNPITSAYQSVKLPAASGMYVVYIYANGEVYQRKLIVR